jgi:hypothetical protein
MAEYRSAAFARRALAQADFELARAAASADRATGHEARVAEGPESVRSLHVRMAELHRRSEQRHRASAEVHRLLASPTRLPPDGVSEPVVLSGVAGLLGASSALVTLCGQRIGAAVAVSDRLAREAYDLEMVMAEGPARDAVRAGRPVLTGGQRLLDRWPRYGPAIAGLGLTAVIAAPLGPPAVRFGVMCALGSEEAISDATPSSLAGVVSALTKMLLSSAEDQESADADILPRLGVVASLDALHQAIGMVSVQCGCGVDDAADLIAARAFAEGSPIADVAADIVASRIRLSED